MPKDPPTPVDTGPFEYALSPEGREAQLTDLAYKCILKRLRDNTASPNETVACLRLGTERAKLEREKIKAESLLANAKVENLESERRQEELYQEAIQMMKEYMGSNG